MSHPIYTMANGISLCCAPGWKRCNSLRVPLLWAEISLELGSGFAVVICSPLQLLFSASAVEAPGGLGQSWFGL